VKMKTHFAELSRGLHHGDLIDEQVEHAIKAEEAGHEARRHHRDSQALMLEPLLKAALNEVDIAVRGCDLRKEHSAARAIAHRLVGKNRVAAPATRALTDVG